MKLLLNTHMLLRAAAGTLPRDAEEFVLDGDNALYFSPAGSILREYPGPVIFIPGVST